MENYEGLAELIDLYEGKLKNLQPDTAEFRQVSSTLNEFYKVRNEAKRIEVELKKAQSDEDRVDIERDKARIEATRVETENKKGWFDLARTGTDLVEFIIGTGMTILSIGSILKFEETGCIRTKAFNMIPKFKWF